MASTEALKRSHMSPVFFIFHPGPQWSSLTCQNFKKRASTHAKDSIFSPLFAAKLMGLTQLEKDKNKAAARRSHRAEPTLGWWRVIRALCDITKA